MKVQEEDIKVEEEFVRTHLDQHGARPIRFISNLKFGKIFLHSINNDLSHYGTEMTKLSFCLFLCSEKSNPER